MSLRNVQTHAVNEFAADPDPYLDEAARQKMNAAQSDFLRKLRSWRLMNPRKLTGRIAYEGKRMILTKNRVPEWICKVMGLSRWGIHFDCGKLLVIRLGRNDVLRIPGLKVVIEFDDHGNAIVKHVSPGSFSVCSLPRLALQRLSKRYCKLQMTMRVFPTSLRYSGSRILPRRKLSFL